MVLLTYCIPCQHGDHDGHYEVIQAVPEGMLGGQRCPCRGECIERAKAQPDLRALLGHNRATPSLIPCEHVAVDALLSDEAIERAARAMNLDAGRQRGLAFEDDWDEITEQERGGWRLCARAALSAALPGEEQS
jgi:hypothetical protein